MNEKRAIEILVENVKSHRTLKKILNHSSTVKQIAVSIAQNINRAKIYKKKINIQTIKAASLLHDIGREQNPPHTQDSIRHNISGERIIQQEIKKLRQELKKTKDNSQKQEKLKDSISVLRLCRRVCRNHIGVGLTKEDIKKNKINLPPANYLPRSIEEKIIAYSDKLVEGERIKDINHCIERYGDWLGENYKKKIIKLHRYLHKLMGDKDKIKVERKSLKILNVLLF